MRLIIREIIGIIHFIASRRLKNLNYIIRRQHYEYSHTLDTRTLENTLQDSVCNHVFILSVVIRCTNPQVLIWV